MRGVHLEKTPHKAFVAAYALVLAACALADGVGRVEYVSADLARRTATVAWTWTDLADSAVRLSLTRNGEDFPTAGWGGTLFIGDGALGCAVSGNPSGYSDLFFDVGRESVPTNGKYAVQIIATNGAGRVEEWARGTLVVRANPAADGMPTNWSAYADIARRVAPLIDCEGLLLNPANAGALWDAVSARTGAMVTNCVDYAAAATLQSAKDYADAAISGASGLTPDMVTNIVLDVAPAPGNYAAVSNAAMNALSRAEAEAGFTEWEWAVDVEPYALPTGWKFVYQADWHTWQLTDANNTGMSVAKAGDENSVAFQFAADEWYDGTGILTAIRTRLPTMADIAAATNGIPRITESADKPGWAANADRAMSANEASLAQEARTATEAGLAYTLGGRAGPAIIEQLDAATATNAQQTAQISTMGSIVNSWEGYWGGTNVIFEVTNYYGNTSGEFPRLRVKELREGSWNTVWDEATKFDACASQIVAVVAASNTALKAEVVDGFAPKAWGAYTDKGATNVVGNSVWMTSPETYFAGGTEYQRVAVGDGAICVLADNGASAYTAGEAGTFRFQDEGGTNYFGFAKSDSYTIGCRTDGITVSGSLVTLRYDVIMGGTDVPILYWRLSLASGEWAQLNAADGTAAQGAPYTVTWYTSGGSYYAAINCGSNASGFFKAETSVAGDVVFETNMKARLDGGIECMNTQTGVKGVIRPAYDGSSVNWSWSAR